VDDGFRRKDLPGSGLPAQARGEVQGTAAEASFRRDGLARVQTDTDAAGQFGIAETVLQLDCGAEALARGGKDDERLVAAQLEQESVPCLDNLANESRKMRSQLRGGLVTELAGVRGVPTDVRDQKRAKLGRQGLILRRAWLGRKPCFRSHRWEER
jgi:hypothetical protein